MVPLPLLFTVALAAPVPASTAALPADTLVDVAGYRLHVEVIRGERPVAFVLEEGGGTMLENWMAVPELIAARTGATVVTYDRAGFGDSGLGPADLTPDAQVEDLREALAALDVPERRILVGHSYGGLMALLHAARHPDEVVGVVLVDGMNPRFVAAVGDWIYSTVPSIEDPADDRERALKRLVDTFGNLAAEVGPLEPMLEQPIAVITAGVPWWDDAAARDEWRASHEAIAAVEGRWLVVAEGSRHQVAREAPDVIVDATERVLAETER